MGARKVKLRSKPMSDAKLESFVQGCADSACEVCLPIRELLAFRRAARRLRRDCGAFPGSPLQLRAVRAVLDVLRDGR